MAYGDFKGLKRRTSSDNVLRDKAFNFSKNHKYDEYQRGLASMVHKCVDKKSKGGGVANNEIKKIPDISNFATKTALTNLSNTVPDITNLIKKSDYDAKNPEIESKIC